MTTATTPRYAISRSLRVPFREAQERIREALQTEGFGVLTEIDVQATLKKKLGVDTAPYLILGACNPGFAHQAIQTEPDIGLLLPCNVVIRSGDQAGATVVEAIDPTVQLGVAASTDLEGIADQVRTRLERALDRLVNETTPPSSGGRDDEPVRE